MKFGGTSVGDPESIRRCAELVEREIQRSGGQPLVVVSAYSKVTDQLLKAAKQAVQGQHEPLFGQIAEKHQGIVKALGLEPDVGAALLAELKDLLHGIRMVREVTPRLCDYVASFGERLSARTFAALLRSRGHADAQAFDAYDLGFLTDSHFMNARPAPDINKRIAQACRGHRGRLMVVTGFIGKDSNGDITTIGRSGSDYTASIFAAALGAEEVQIWKDVPGVMTADPSLIPDARPLPRLSFQEASELAYYGAEVLHPTTIVPAIEAGRPVRVLNTFDPEAPGTLILAAGECDPRNPVKCIAYKEDLALINVRSERMLGMEGFMARLFQVFEKHRIVIDMISTSEVSVSMTTEQTDARRLEALRKDLAELGRVEIQGQKCIVAIVGEGMKHTVGLAARTFRAVSGRGVSVQMISQGASEINITFLIDNSEIPQVVAGLHEEFFGKK
jgi:aspartate kinase